MSQNGRPYGLYEVQNMQAMYPGLSIREIEAIYERNARQDAADALSRAKYMVEEGPRHPHDYQSLDKFLTMEDERRRREQRSAEQDMLRDHAIRRRGY